MHVTINFRIKKETRSKKYHFELISYNTIDYRKVFPLNLNCTPLIEFSLAKKLYPFHTVAIHKV